MMLRKVGAFVNTAKASPMVAMEMPHVFTGRLYSWFVIYSLLIPDYLVSFELHSICVYEVRK
jgi:hypothetical protein